jgi:hypothetical protein
MFGNNKLYNKARQKPLQIGQCTNSWAMEFKLLCSTLMGWDLTVFWKTISES